jgi:hypothetical protein
MLSTQGSIGSLELVRRSEDLGPRTDVGDGLGPSRCSTKELSWRSPQLGAETLQEVVGGRLEVSLQEG